MNTVYPGNRISTGGGISFSDLLRYMQSLSLPVSTGQIVGNECESALIVSIWHAPFGLVCHKEERHFVRSNVYSAVFLHSILCIRGSNLACKDNIDVSGDFRTTPANIIYFGINNVSSRFVFDSENIGKKFLPFAACLAVTYEAIANYRQKGYLLPLFCILILVAIFWIAAGCLNIQKKWGRQAVILMTIVSIGLSGFFVNPVQQGSDFLLNCDLLNSARNISKEDPNACWIMTDSGLGNLLPIAGVNAIGSTNVYPALNFWNKLDENYEQEEIYNRYSHAEIYLTEDKTEFQLIQADFFG